MPAIPNPELLTYSSTVSRWEPVLEYVRARLEIQCKKDAGEPWPWTRDKILRKHKFCCVFRDDDRTSREAREMILSLPTEEERRCCAASFRLYNWAPTLKRFIDADLATCTDPVVIEKCLRAVTPHYNTLAYRVQPGGRIWHTGDICNAIAKAHKAILSGWVPPRTAQQTCLVLGPKLGVAGFPGYQAMQDLRWVFHTYTDEDTWCLVGIGAHRGLKRILGGYTGNTDWKQRNRDRPKIGKDLSIPAEYRRPLQELLAECKKISQRFNLFEVEHNLCETDKRERISSGEGVSRYYTRNKT